MVIFTSLLSRFSNKLHDLRNNRQFTRSIDRVGSQINRYASPDHLLRVLFAPPFAIYSPCFVHDRLMAYALRLRGADVTPIFCDALQSVECNVYGGKWKHSGEFRDGCAHCTERAKALWKDNPTPPIPLSEHILPAEIDQIAARVAALPDDTWHTYREDELTFGVWAKDILVNNYVVGDFRLIPDYERLGRAHLQNLLILNVAYDRILDAVKPDRVVSNDSYYGMWAIMQRLCVRRGIPFYSYWPVGKTRTAAAYNDAAMNLNFHASWKVFSAQPLTESQQARVDEWMGGRLGKRDTLISTHQVDTDDTARRAADEIFRQLDNGKPTALLPSNVIWDLAALNKQVVFADMMEWITETIEWFRGHPQYQLVIKAHPAELHPSIPATRERVEVVLNERGITLPDNVILLSPRVTVTVYDLFPLTRVGIVHTTTTGSEMVAEGIPVITTGRAPYRDYGFTYDVSEKAAYFSTLEQLLSQAHTANETHRELACKFIYFQNFVYYNELGFVENVWSANSRLKVARTEDILPGKLPHFDYLIDSIIEGLPILGAERFPQGS